MDKFRQFRPYSFRNRLLLMLTVSCLVASVISLAFSYVYTRSNVRTELTDDQHELAQNLVLLHASTGLTPETFAGIARDDLSIELGHNEILETLGESERVQLTECGYCTQFAKGGMPLTYVMLDDILLVITPSTHFNVFLRAFLRISLAAVSFFSVFMLMSLLTSWRIARPVSELTRATRLVAGGDFSVRLPENNPDEIGHLMRSFNAMTDALGRTSYLQKDFISSISHEFRTPIASIKGFARLLQMPDLSESDRQDYVQMIAQESERLSRLSNTLLRLSALEQQTAPASLSTFRLDEQVREVILRMEPVWSQRDIDWQLELSGVTIESDSELLNQVWINLLQNAMKFSADGSSIEVRVFEHDHLAHFVVRDHGIGMDEATLSRIFDRFFQADRSRSHEGVGLGLTLVKRILIILGGTVEVTSTKGEGTTFTVMLPTHITNTKEIHHV